MQKTQSASSEKQQALSAGKTLSLLDALQEVYATREMQLKLKELREAHGIDKLKKRGPFNGTTRAFTQELHSMLISVQAPVFERFDLPCPPEGLDILVLSFNEHADNEQLKRAGFYCRMLLGQMGFMPGLELPLDTLFTLLCNLRSVYGQPDLQQKLKELMEKHGMGKVAAKGRCSCHATSLAYAREQRDLLAEFQEPVFHELRLPGPPVGIDLLQSSILHWSKHNAQVVSVGNECRWLLGQFQFKAGQITGGYHFDSQALDKGVEIRRAGRTGHGMFAVRSFAAGERILLEEPLAMLPGTDILSTPSAPLELWRSGQVQNILSSQLTSGPKKSPKRAMYGDFARAALQNHGLSEQEMCDVIKALCIFSFNAFAVRGNRSQALFRCICMSNHSCTPNAFLVTSNAGPSELICIKDIEVDDEITLSYLTAKELFFDYTDRQQHLFRNWEFRCLCARCMKEQDKDTEASCHEDILNCEAQLELDICYAW